MKRVAYAAAVTAAVLGAGWAAGQDGRTPTVKEIMNQLHKGANPPVVVLKRELQSGQPNWPEVQRMTHEFSTMGAALARNAPPRGDRASWARLAGDYAQNAHALDEAAARRDPQAAMAARNRLAGSCTGCHQAHKGG